MRQALRASRPIDTRNGVAVTANFLGPTQVAYDFSLSNAIVPVDRDGDRRWASMVMKRRAAEAEGKEFPDAAVVTGEYLWANLRLAEKAYSLESLRIFAWVYI